MAIESMVNDQKPRVKPATPKRVSRTLRWPMSLELSIGFRGCVDHTCEITIGTYLDLPTIQHVCRTWLNLMDEKANMLHMEAPCTYGSSNYVEHMPNLAGFI